MTENEKDCWEKITKQQKLIGDWMKDVENEFIRTHEGENQSSQLRCELIKKRCEFNVQVLSSSYDLGGLLEYNKWSNKIPFINFPNNWSVRFVPPFAGAFVRFHVKDENDNAVSVYLDCHDILGSLNLITIDEPVPYWEIYPYEEDIQRVKMENVEELIAEIRHAFEYLKKNPICESEA